MNRRSGPDALVVGAGIAGLTAAIELADRGRRVLLLDSAERGAASWSSAGLLAPGLGFTPEVMPHAVAARDAFPDYLHMLRETTGVDVGLDRGGILELAGDEEVPARRRDEAPDGAEFLDADALARLEPALAGHPGALLHHRDGAVDTGALLAALGHRAAAHPHVTRRAARVRSVAVGRAGPMIVADDARWEAAEVVIAAGAWAGMMSLPHPLPVRPVHGELLLLDHHRLRHVTCGAGGYLVPRRAGLLVGATSDERGFEVAAGADGRRTLLGVAERVLPGSAQAPALAHTAGLRPVTPDGLPILGLDPLQPAVAYACGYSRNGILFAPWAATRLGRLLDGEAVPELAPFAVDRFR